ncbi:protein kinase [Sorangium sp. So ce260]|uniref:protein kinase domain-containing protein n=1 Tax=Sorangium sp. So ce260 TaxID=3133291 RepID=UPI003F63388F
MRAGDIVGSRFEIEGHATAGGMAQIFRARDRLTGEPVAVKVLQRRGPQETHRFVREAQALATLRHPGIVGYVAHGTTEGGDLFLAMQWLSGETLAERFLREPLTVPESLALGARVASTLGALHRLGIVHRDLKPSNLLLVGGSVDEVTLLDFGVARVAEAGQELTMPGVMLGTPGYMAPEQARGELTIDARADVFALGCVLYRCLTGRPPFVGNDGLSVLVKVLLEDPPRLRELRGEVPAALDDLVTRMLAKAPRDRPRDGAAVAAELASLGDLAPGSRRGLPLPIGGPAPELTTGERRMICLLLARDGALDSDATRSEGEDALRVRALSALAERHQGRLEIIESRSPVVVLSGAVAPTDLAARGARCALAMQVLLGGAPVALVSGRTELTARSPIGNLIDQAAALLAGDAARPGVVRIDEVTAGLLGARFDLGSDHAGHLLRGERDDLEVVPRLLGKPTPCVGRDRELSLLEATFVQCIEEQTPSAVLVTAPAGMGKSRLRTELLRRIRARGEAMEVWIARGDPMSAGASFGLLAQVLRRALGLADGAPAPAVQRRIRERVARHGEHGARLAPFLGELVGAPFPDEESEALRVARRSSVLMGDQLHLAWEEFLRAECAAQPVLLVLEDLHWGDLPTVAMINSALRNLRDAPFMVLALGRPEVREMFPKLWAGRGVQEIELTGLSRRASERLVRQALGNAVAEEVVATLVERADGNAFFLEEQIRAAAEGRGAALPETVLAMVQARLEALDPEARRVLRAASVFGQSFRPAGAAALLGGADAEVGDRLAELVEREVIVPRRQPGREGARGEDLFSGLSSSSPRAAPGDGSERDASCAAAALEHGPLSGAVSAEPEYSFRHGLVREAAYGALTDYDRQLGHRLAGEWLEGEGKGDAAELAEHFERGAEPGRAATWYRRAAEQALRGNDLLAAIRHAARGLACGAAGAEAGGLLLVEAEARVWHGDFAVAEQRALDAVALFEPGSPSWYSAVTEVVMAAGKQGALDRVESWVVTAQGASPREGALTRRDICLVEGALWLVFGGRYAAADGIIAALERSEGEGRSLDVEVLARLYEARAIRAMTSGDPGACLEGIEAALAVFERSGDRRNACSLRVNLGAITMELGDYEGAEAALRAALRAAEQMELTDLAAFARSNLGNVMIARGDLDEARRVEAEAIATFQRLGDPRAEGVARAYLGKAALLAGDLGAAEAEARAAAELLQSAPPLRAAAWALSARVLLRKGRVDEALALSGEALALLSSLGAVEEGESLIRLVRAEALFASGRQDEAIAAIARARDSVLSRAGQISSPRYRDQFLSSLDNGETLALAARWLGDSEAR